MESKNVPKGHWAGFLAAVAEKMDMMETRKVQLHYPLSRLTEPIITRLVTEFDLAPNLLRADVDVQTGAWIVAEIAGETENISKAEEWMRSHGIEVTEAPAATQSA